MTHDSTYDSVKKMWEAEEDRGKSLAEGLVQWWALAGVDMAVADAPTTWLAPKRELSPPSPADAPAPQPLSAEPAQAAFPAFPDELNTFTHWLSQSQDIPEARWGGPIIVQPGNAAAGLMVITDMPDRDDSAEEGLFSGGHGRLFDRMLGAIGRERETVYCASIAVTRPVGGGLSPADAEHLVARMRHHIGLVRPRNLLLLGERTVGLLTGRELHAQRGSLLDLNLGDRTCRAVATYHPRVLATHPAAKAEAWQDLLLLIEGWEA